MTPVSLGAKLAVPDGAVGVVLFAIRGADPVRDPIRLQLADFLHHAGLATLVASLSGVDEGPLPLERAAARVASSLAWIGTAPRLRDLPVGVFADGPAVAASLLAMAHDPDRVAAFVGCGGRPDEAPGALSRVRGPTLLVVGADNALALEAARTAVRKLPEHAEVAVIDETKDPLGEPEGAGTVGWLARRWFLSHLAAPIA